MTNRPAIVSLICSECQCFFVARVCTDQFFLDMEQVVKQSLTLSPPAELRGPDTHRSGPRGLLPSGFPHFIWSICMNQAPRSTSPRSAQRRQVLKGFAGAVTLAGVGSAAWAQAGKEAPALAKMVSDGKLPALAQRLPRHRW